LDRREPRKPVTMVATCKSTGFRDRVLILDISRKGCRIESAGIPLSVNQDLVLQFDGLEDMLGTVRWVKGNCAGVELDYLLHPSVVEHLRSTFPHTVDRRIGPATKSDKTHPEDQSLRSTS